MSRSRWLTGWQNPMPGPGHVALVCVPPAGAGCGQYRAWQSQFDHTVTVLGVAMPGREHRWSEPPPTDMTEATAAIGAAIADQIPSQVPVVLFGQSFGGLIGYEVAQYLSQRHDRTLAALAVAACRPPHLWVGAGQGLVDDDSALLELLDLRALDDEDIDEDSREMLLDLMRADARLSMSYQDPTPGPLTCPLSIWGGADDPIVTAEHLDGWRDYAGAAGSRHRQFPGGHYFTTPPTEPLLLELRSILGRAREPESATR